MNTDALCKDLQSIWDQSFPLCGAMGLTVVSFENHLLTTQAPLVLNTNIHGTAFAGSLYAIEAITAWGVLYLELKCAGLDASLIHAHGEINFAHTINEDIHATADFSNLLDHIDELTSTGKTRLTIDTEVHAADRIASRFTGDYLARLRRTDQ